MSSQVQRYRGAGILISVAKRRSLLASVEVSWQLASTDSLQTHSGAPHSSESPLFLAGSMQPTEGGMLPDRRAGPAGVEMAQPRSASGHDHGLARVDLDNADGPAKCGQCQPR